MSTTESGTYRKIQFGDGLTATQVDANTVRVDAGGGGGGSGIMFNTSPQAGDWLEVHATGREASGDGEAGRDSSIALQADDGDIYIWQQDGGFDGNRAVYVTGDGGLYMAGGGPGGILLRSGTHGGDGDMLFETQGGSGLQMRVKNYLKINMLGGGTEFSGVAPFYLGGLPTTDPHSSDQLWNDNGNIVYSGFTGGGSGGDLNYVYTQPTPASTWSIAHALGKYPAVEVVDSGGSILLPDVLYLDANNVSVIFGSATSGKAYLN